MNGRIAITIKPTHACNMRCRHCYHADEGFGTECLSLDYAKKIVALAAEEYKHVIASFHGGEPTLWGIKNFKSILEYEQEIKKSHPAVTIKNMIQTNALLLNEEWFELFAEGRFSVGTSFDGPHNDDLRQNTSQVYSILKSMQKYGIDFDTLCVETNLSISRILETYEWFKAEGFNYKILALFMSGEANAHPEIELDNDIYVNNLSRLYRIWLYDKKCSISVKTCEDLLRVSNRMTCMKYGGNCIFKRICINPNGDIYPCGRPYTDDFKLGHISALKSISQAFDSDAYKKLVDLSVSRCNQCKEKCRFFAVCNGGCISDAILEGSFDRIGNVTCERTKMLLDAITEINQDALSAFDQKNNLDQFNPHALKVMESLRNREINQNK